MTIEEKEEQFKRLVLDGDYATRITKQLGISYKTYYEWKIKLFPSNQ